MSTVLCILVKGVTTMDDPIRNHPTRDEQLDILATLIADQARSNDQIIDFGCGTGYIAHLTFCKR